MTKNIILQWASIQRKLGGMTEHILEPHGAAAWSPNTDVYESHDDVMIKVELAGVAKESIQVNLENQVVVICGMRRDPYGGESTAGYRFRQMEIEYGPFQRTVSLPFPVDGNQVTAHMVNGILKIRLPRAQAAASKKITVSTDD
ncbi:MAG: Spore protein SP21 [Verrucomicrobia bacterium ADurb.Bin345]|nr:MAG: Spore protein SP21 [Verrucomicrobia bacterium ADurb.Bin345]